MLLLNLLFWVHISLFQCTCFTWKIRECCFDIDCLLNCCSASLVMVFFTCERIHVSCPWEAVPNRSSNYSSCCSKTLSFSFKTASLLLVADSTYSGRFPAHPKSLHVSTSVSNLQHLQIHVSADLSDIQR
jgi:hypothetical protein